jgi:hypothetical protein
MRSSHSDTSENGLRLHRRFASLFKTANKRSYVLLPVPVGRNMFFQLSEVLEAEELGDLQQGLVISSPACKTAQVFPDKLLVRFAQHGIKNRKIFQAMADELFLLA